MHLPQTSPWLDDDELAELADAIKKNWITEGEKTAAFELAFAEFIGARHAIAVPNGTIALFLALRASGVAPGDEVIIPSFTFIATSNAVELCGAEPVAVDVDPETFNIAPAAVEKAITNRTKAVVPVHVYGQSADMTRIREVAHRHDLRVVEDAAESLGSTFEGQQTGILGDVAAFSFYGNKVITTGEGGMITTQDDALAERIRRLKNHGRLTKGHFRHDQLGFNFRFTDLQAAVGLAQMRKLPEILARRERLLAAYAEGLRDFRGIRIPTVDKRATVNGWFANILVDDPARVLAALEAQGIGSRRFFPPLHTQPCYQGKWKGAFPAAEEAFGRGLSLPTSASMTAAQVGEVVRALTAAVRAG